MSKYRIVLLSHCLLFLQISLCLASSKPSFEELMPPDLLETIPKEHHSRFARSVEGGPCTVSAGGVQPSIYLGTNGLPISVPVNSPPYFGSPAYADSCIFDSLPMTRCNSNTGKCECDPAISVRLNAFPGAGLCLPLSYPNITKGLCLPSFPDMCDTLASGSYCGFVQVGSVRQLKCICRNGIEAWPNCMPKIGSPCQNTTVCWNQIPNSYCANIVNGFGTCKCLTTGIPYTYTQFGTANIVSGTATQTSVPSLQQNRCEPVFCPAVSTASGAASFVGLQACQGDPLPQTVGGLVPAPDPINVPFVCTNTSRGYDCTCKAGTKGRGHNAIKIGRCCLAEHLVCSDYSKCLFVSQLCDGVPDCNDCSDERSSFCTGAWPQNAPQCGVPNRNLPPGDEFVQQLNQLRSDQLAQISGQSSGDHPKPAADSITEW
ncbi:hypothetical protein BV898_00610 [Hypsibius exemplaris]|uniref:EGF-like domain-containing protein n=1 Tax=Hypsibius exemplaris TaxID=2072580 RepID=A0A1W0XDY3_HYPEX|nr:hypothetical protein BV898_00610 [Hypsibius exemplaris]